jgi:hypothetical protein
MFSRLRSDAASNKDECRRQLMEGREYLCRQVDDSVTSALRKRERERQTPLESGPSLKAHEPRQTTASDTVEDAAAPDKLACGFFSPLRARRDLFSSSGRRRSRNRNSIRNHYGRSSLPKQRLLLSVLRTAGSIHLQLGERARERDHVWRRRTLHRPSLGSPSRRVATYRESRERLSLSPRKKSLRDALDRAPRPSAGACALFRIC